MAKKVIVGDIWKQKGFKVVSTNLGGVHGRGLAAQAKQKGLITRFNKSFATSPKNSDVITLAVKGNAPETARINVGGKPQPYSEQTTGKNVELLKSEVNELIKFARKNPTKNINLPFIGLGFGEGNPDDILPILREAEKEPNIFLVSKDEGTVKRYQSTFRAGVRSDKSKVMSKKVKIKVISGGQVGADRIGLEEARKLGFDTGGTAPIKYATTKIQGVQQYDPSLKDFGVTEIDPKLKSDYSKRTGKFDTFGARTEQNVLKSDLTVIYTVKGRENSPGSKLTRNLATEHGKPYLQNPSSEQITKAVSKLGKENVTINIAGNREFKDSKIISEGLQAASSASPTLNVAKNLSSAIKSRVSPTNYSKKFRQKLPTEIREAQNIIKSRKQTLDEIHRQPTRKYKVQPFDLRKFFSSKTTDPISVYSEGEVRPVVKKDPDKKRFKSSKNYPTKKGIWFQGAHEVTDRGAVIKTLDKVYGEAMKTYKKEDIKIYYGGNKSSQTDVILQEWTTKNKIPLVKIDPTKVAPVGDTVFTKTDKFKQQLANRDKWLKRMKEKGQILSINSISPSGEIKYDSKLRTKWRDRLGELSEQYGKGQTRKIHEAYLDEVEDEIKGVSRQDPSEYKVIQQTKLGPKGEKQWRITKKVGTGSILDQGQTRSTVKKPNIDSALAAIEVLEEKNEFVTTERRKKIIKAQPHLDINKIEVSEWLKDISKKRIANIRGDVSNPLSYGQRIEVDYPDQPGIPEGKEHVVTDSVGTYEKPSHLKKGVKVHDTNKPAMKAPIVQQLITDVVNIDPKEMGYTGKNVFGDFFKRDIELEAKKETYEGRDLNKQKIDDITDEFGEGAEVHKDKHLQRQKIADKKEIHALNKLLRKMPKDLDTLPLDKKLAWEKTLLTELMNIPDTHAEHQVSVLGASYSKDKKTKSGEWKPEGKVLGEKPKYRTKPEIKKALPSELLEEKKWLKRETKTSEPKLVKRFGEERLHKPTEKKWSTEDARKKAELKGKGAYVSDPSKASAGDIRTNISTKKPLPKGLAGSLAKWLGRFSIVLAPILGYSSLKSKKAEASVKNVAQETTSVLIGSERVFGSVGNKGYFQNVGLTKQGVPRRVRHQGPIKDAGGKDTPYASLMKFFSPSTKDAWKNRKRVRRN